MEDEEHNEEEERAEEILDFPNEGVAGKTIVSDCIYIYTCIYICMLCIKIKNKYG